MRTPAAAGLPADLFPSWRKGQERAVRELLFTKERFNLCVLPTGAGKSVIYMAAAGIDDSRALVLTATRALQDQNLGNFESMGLADMRGRNNYTCNIDTDRQADEAVCVGGVFCSRMKDGGCDYFDDLGVARSGRLVQTNYRYWLHAEESETLGRFQTLILDEAHKAPDEIGDFAAVEVTAGELAKYGIQEPGRWTGYPGAWATRALMKVEAVLSREGDEARRRKTKRLQRRLSRLCRLSAQQWVQSRPEKDTWRWDLVEPGALAEDLLFRGASKVVFVSASIRRKTLRMLGVDGRSDGQRVHVIEQESTFPVRNRPIYYWPVAGVGRKMTAEKATRWHEAMDEFIAPRLDRRGLIHTVSYDRAWDILNRSQHRRAMILHKRGQDLGEVLREYKARRPPVILLSPAISTGTDFPYTTAEYQIIPKVPFPDLSSPLVQARTRVDPEYGFYIAMQNLVQAAGRIVRADDDQGETLILDSNFGWLRARHWDFAPRWFHAAVKTIKADGEPPDPLPALDRAA